MKLNSTTFMSNTSHLQRLRPRKIEKLSITTAATSTRETAVVLALTSRAACLIVFPTTLNRLLRRRRNDSTRICLPIGRRGRAVQPNTERGEQDGKQFAGGNTEDRSNRSDIGLGHGLSYTTFTFENLTVSPSHYTRGQKTCKHACNQCWLATRR